MRQHTHVSRRAGPLHDRDPCCVQVAAPRRRHEHHRRHRDRNSVVPNRDSREADRRLAPAHRGDTLAQQGAVEDRSQGVQLATLRELARYWTTEYDWRCGRMFPSSNDGVISEVGASQRRLHLPVESPSPSPSATTAWAKRSLRCAQSRLFACATLRLTMTPMCCPFELPSWARTRTLLIHRGHSNRPREVPGQAFRNSGSQTKCTT
jgi:hypothetical protein